jgi:acetyl esterase/lipase
MTKPHCLALFLMFGLVWYAKGDEKPAEPERKEEKKPTTLGGNFEVEAVKDITYCEGDEADAVKHKLDLFLPKGQKDFPVLFFVHGGTWSSGDRKLYGPLGETFAKNGIGTVIISYRLSPKVQHPAHIEDVAKAFAWTVRNIAKHGGNAEQIFVSGHSAGGHLSALLATDEKYLKAEKLDRTSIKAAIPLSGVYTIVPAGKLATVFGKDADVARDASPLTHVTDKLPPFLILYADKDIATIDKVSETFCEAIKKKKGEASAVKIEDRTHITIITKLAASDTDPATVAMLTFIAKQTGRKLIEKESK